MRSLLILDVLQMVCDSKEKKGEPNQAPLKNFTTNESEYNHIQLIKVIVPYLFNAIASPGMVAQDLCLPIVVVKLCVGYLIRSAKLYMTHLGKCPVTGNQEYFFTINLQKYERFKREGMCHD